MKLSQTLAGGLRIDAEDAADWEILRAVVSDANFCESDLASRLGGLVSEEAGATDWQEYVVPDLREEFQDELAQVGAAIEAAEFEADGGGGSLWINREDVFQWYGSFNQARLAIEELYHFESVPILESDVLVPGRLAAFLRSQFYLRVQRELLKHVMK